MKHLFVDKKLSGSVASTGFAQLRCSETIIPYFLYYLLNSPHFNKHVDLRCTGTGYPAIKGSDVISIPCKIPSLPEQEKIAGLLSALDESISVETQALELFKEQKKGYLQKLFSQELRFRDDNGRMFPDWEEKKLGEILSLGKSGGTPKSDNQSYYNGNINFLGISDITKAGKYVSKTEKTITEEGLDNSSAWVIPTGCLLYAMYASVGKVAISKTPMAISQAVFAMKLKDNCSLEYLYQYFTHFQSNGLKAYITTGTQGNINANTLKNFFIPLPSFLEQQKIAEFLSALDDRIELQQEKVSLLKEQKKGYLQGIFG